MAHCGLVDEAPNPPAPRLYHENLGHGAGLMSSHNQMPCGACGSSLSLPLWGISLSGLKEAACTDGFWKPAKQIWDAIEEGETFGEVVVSRTIAAGLAGILGIMQLRCQR